MDGAGVGSRISRASKPVGIKKTSCGFVAWQVTSLVLAGLQKIRYLNPDLSIIQLDLHFGVVAAS
jgi:hypothetical protein